MMDPLAHGPQAFATTQWSLVAAANADEASQTRARLALEELCRAYWYPLYAFARYRGHASQEAQDLTQSFFTRVFETNGLAYANPERGRFRSYLLGAMKHFLANEWHRGQAQKRGGDIAFVGLDALEHDELHSLEAADSSDPDAGFDREWALQSTARALQQLRSEMEQSGKGAQFEALKGSLTGAEPERSETAATLGMTVGAVKVAVHRLRQRYRELLRAEIAQTVSDPTDVDDEMRHLVDVLRRQ